MFAWLPYAMVRISAFFIAGILIGVYLPDDFPAQAISEILTILIVTYFGSWFALRHKSSLRMLTGITGLLSMVCVGYLMVISKTESINPDHFMHSGMKFQSYLAKIIDDPEERPYGWRIKAEVIGIRQPNGWTTKAGKVLIISKENIHVEYGDRLLIRGTPQEIPEPSNPGAFDYKSYQRFRNIYHQQFVQANQWIRINSDRSLNILSLAHRARSWASHILTTNLTGLRERAVVQALVLGITDDLDNELLGAYSGTGTMHILSVSGLHVGIIYGLILLLLKPWNGISWSRWIVAGIALSCLWSYAFITGLSPSVLRSVTMFSFVALAKPFGRSTNIYNTLASSAFLLLMYDPYLIMSVGFQLSYLAVLAIVYMQKPIQDLWAPSNRWIFKIWQLACVSIAAQTGTAALGLFYFHQFPVYFLISNMLVVPLSSAVLVNGILLVLSGGLPSIAAYTGIILQFLTRLLNQIVFFIDGMPFNVVDHIYISSMECLILFGLLFGTILFLKTKKFIFFGVTFLLLTTFLLSRGYRLWSFYHHDQCVVYQIPGHVAIDWRVRGKNYLLADSALREDRKRLEGVVFPNRMTPGNPEEGLFQQIPFQINYSGFSYFACKGTSLIWIIDPNADLPRHIEADYVVISKGNVQSIGRLMDHIRIKHLILDGSNTMANASRWKEEAAKYHIALYDCNMEGAFILNL
jgi:competence protein ComEC